MFVCPLHRFGAYRDYYRFSPEGLSTIFERFKIVAPDGWGNSAVLRLAHDHSDRGHEGSAPVSKPEAGKLGLYSYTDKMNYVMTWCIAMKP